MRNSGLTELRCHPRLHSGPERRGCPRQARAWRREGGL